MFHALIYLQRFTYIYKQIYVHMDVRKYVHMCVCANVCQKITQFGGTNSLLAVCLSLFMMLALANRANLSISTLLYCLQHAYGQLYLNFYFLTTLFYSFYCSCVYVCLFADSSSTYQRSNTIFSIALMAFSPPN